MDTESLKKDENNENNEIIDHAEAIRKIVAQKCARCGGGMSGCMGCLFDTFDRGMIPAALDRILNLMGQMPNDRPDAIAAGTRRHDERERNWRMIQERGSGTGENQLRQRQNNDII